MPALIPTIATLSRWITNKFKPFHMHTKILAAPDGEKYADAAEYPPNSSFKPKKPPIGNREVVRKYREKKKAETTSLEEEVLHLTSDKEITRSSSFRG